MSTSVSPSQKADNQIRIAKGGRVGPYGKTCLYKFVNHESLELRGRGEAVALTIDLAEFLVRANRATIEKISTGTTDLRKPELVVVVKRTAVPDLKDLADERDDEHVDA